MPLVRWHSCHTIEVWHSRVTTNAKLKENTAYSRIFAEIECKRLVTKHFSTHKRMDKQNNMLDVILVWYRWRKPILGLVILVTVASAAIVFMLPIYYKATTVFYPSNPILRSPSVIFGTSQRDLEYFGGTADADRLLSVAYSNEFLQQMVRDFKLYEHYKIDPKAPKAAHKMELRFFGLYEAHKTDRGGIELSMEDEDPTTSAAMANAARDKIDALMNKMNTDVQQKLLDAFEKDIAEKNQQVSNLSDSLARVRERFGVYVDFSQENGALGLKAKNGDMGRFNEGLAQVQVLGRLLTAASEDLAESKTRLDKLKATFSAGISSIVVQDVAQMPNIKSRPKRLFLVALSAAVALLFACIAVLLLDTYKNIDWKEVLQ
jgi:uncharacterized protein involved in exopolysaccharide biosynthesis